MMCRFADTAVCRLAEVSGNEDTLALALSAGRAVLVSAASASAWLLPLLSFIIGIEQSRGQGQEDGLFLSAEGDAEAVGKVFQELEK